MKTLCMLAGLAIVSAGIAATGLGGNAAPSIEGTYELTYRELPDGTKVQSPEIIGLITFTKDRRNFNIYWTENGKPVSISAISSYTLSDKEYTEKNEYYLTNDAAGGKGITYDTYAQTGRAPVTVTGDRVKFKLPLHEEPELAFEKNTFTATRTGAFVDHWKKVN